MAKSGAGKRTTKKTSGTKEKKKSKSDMLMSEDMEQDLVRDHAEQNDANKKPDDFHRKK